ncbi:polysaccharide biosynthesis protein [Lentilactobacillus farraginis]|uniref:Membrane protein n=1 Tax=Lentilactobacillus farraginis DSM 18382 = JCM 14108 TaxID=1423743 RepID=X0PGQ8_9LACO|nr:polysaccharide biosynthesis protein [Lentilactobacillus farraginis]GAF36162.1 membrane protein [Lentilactobacillus farraginis DSM 18382 = JCM 14108]
MNKKIMSGSFWLSFGSIFSRVLGVIYLIPWLAMMGSAANQNAAQALFSTSYTPYALFISLGTAGFPSAIARRVAYYNGENKFLNSKRLAKVGLGIMLISGVVCGILLYVLAPLLSANSPVVSPAVSTTAIRFLVPAIVILPAMSAARGWFQGNQDLKPFGVSQLWEQFIRIIFILVSTYVVIYIFHKTFIHAVYLSVMAALVGALASCFYLATYYKKQSADYAEKSQQSKPYDLEGIGRTFKMIAYESIPFVVVGSGISLTQLVDQLVFKQVMENVLHKTALYTQNIFTMFSANPTKITTVVVSLALAVAETTLPILASSRSAGKQNIGDLVLQNLNMLIFALVPIVTILSALSFAINGVFFPFSFLGGRYLFWNIIQSLILGLAINSLTLLQALHYSKKAMFYLIIGLIIKLVLQVPFVTWLQGFGAILATAIAFGLVCLLSIREICKEFKVKLSKLTLNIIVNVVFAISVGLAATGMERVYLPLTKVSAFVYAAVFGLVALLIYLAMANATGLSKQVFDKKIGYRYFRYKHFE